MSKTSLRFIRYRIESGWSLSVNKNIGEREAFQKWAKRENSLIKDAQRHPSGNWMLFRKLHQIQILPQMAEKMADVVNLALTFVLHCSFQVRTSYLPNEILWGHQFDHNVVVYDKKMGSYQIFHSRVNKTITDDTPRLSARQLDMRSKRNSSGLSNSSTTTTNNSPSKKPFKRLATVA